MAEFILSARDNLDRLVLVDESASMLAYSEKWRDAGATLKMGSAFSLPVPSNAFDLVVSCLGDPYNTFSFWTEVRRLLVPGEPAYSLHLPLIGLIVSGLPAIPRTWSQLISSFLMEPIFNCRPLFARLLIKLSSSAQQD